MPNPNASDTALAQPSLTPIGPPQRIERSPEYGQRAFARRTYRRRSLRGTVLDGRPPAAVDAYFRDAWLTWGRSKRAEANFTVLPNGDYQVDVLDPLAPVPDRVSFKAGYGPKRAELRNSLDLVIGATNGGRPLVADADGWPHAIIAGSSGGGKSVFIASLLAQIADKSPGLVRLALGDLAGSDLGPFARLPHSIGPLADDLPSVLTLFQRVETELVARQAFLTAPFAIRRPDGSINEIEDGVPNVDTWNTLAVKLGRPDLTLPRVLVAVDEWKQAMDGSEDALELAALAGRVMRVGRKWGGRAWLIAQEPKKGQGKDITFPSDILTNADTRIALAKGATPLLWRLILGDGRSLDDDLPQLKGAAGDVVKGRGIFHSAGEDVVFQGLFISREHDHEDLSSELTRFIRSAARAAELGPESRLLTERPYAPGGRVRRVLVDPAQPGDAAISVDVVPVSGGVDSRQATGRSGTGAFGPLPGGPQDDAIEARDHPGEDAGRPVSNEDESVGPWRPSQTEIRQLEPLAVLRVLYREQAEAEGPIEVSRATLATAIRSEHLTPPGNDQLSRSLRQLTDLGFLVQDGLIRRLAFGSWHEARRRLASLDPADHGAPSGADEGEDAQGKPPED